MKLENQVCSLELAKKLKKLGVKKESIFFYEWTGTRELSMNENSKTYFNIDGINAYTVAELGEMLPANTLCRKILDGGVLLFTACYHTKSAAGFADKPVTVKAITEADCKAKMLIYVIERGDVKNET